MWYLRVALKVSKANTHQEREVKLCGEWIETRRQSDNGKNYLVAIVSNQTDLSIILLGQSSTELKKCLGVSIISLHLIIIYVKSSCTLKY